MYSVLLKNKPVMNADPATVEIPTQLHEADKHFGKDKEVPPYQIVCKKLKKNTSTRGLEENKIPLTYIGMIAKAIGSSPEKRFVLADIYRYMQRRFSHYLRNKPRWKNTVRHNLSYHKCFVKCESSKGTKRSHYWIIHPDFVEQFNRENYNKELDDDVPVFSTSETANRRPSPGQQLSFLNHGHLQPQLPIATSSFSPRELTLAHCERMIQAPPIPSVHGLIPFMPPQSHMESYMQPFTMACSHPGPLKFHPGLDQRDPYRYPYHQYVPVHGEFNSLKTPTTSMGYTQELSEDYPVDEQYCGI